MVPNDDYNKLNVVAIYAKDLSYTDSSCLRAESRITKYSRTYF